MLHGLPQAWRSPSRKQGVRIPVQESREPGEVQLRRCLCLWCCDFSLHTLQHAVWLIQLSSSAAIHDSGTHSMLGKQHGLTWHKPPNAAVFLGLV